MLEWVFVAGGGALGAVARHAVNLAVVKFIGSSLIGTFAANVTGSLVLGVLIGLWESLPDVPFEYKLFLAVGFLGSYTTFSTLAVAVTQGVEAGDFGRAGLNLAGSIAVGLLAAFGGLALGRAMG